MKRKNLNIVSILNGVPNHSGVPYFSNGRFRTHLPKKCKLNNVDLHYFRERKLISRCDNFTDDDPEDIGRFNLIDYHVYKLSHVGHFFLNRLGKK